MNSSVAEMLRWPILSRKGKIMGAENRAVVAKNWGEGKRLLAKSNMKEFGGGGVCVIEPSRILTLVVVT